jgi:hypothetical protein
MGKRERFPSVEFGGRTYRRWQQAGYFVHQSGSVKTHRIKLYLHREIWRSIHGPIPVGYVIHHKDGDHGNNAIDNLELMTRAKHVRFHQDNEEHRAHLRRIQHLGNTASHVSRRRPENRAANRQRMLTRWTKTKSSQVEIHT